jgi:Holliday junction DNA helicase RuvA
LSSPFGAPESGVEGQPVIASLEGTVAAVGSNHVIVTVGGVGFRVYVPDNVLHHVGGPGTHIRLFTHLYVRENELALYGCTTHEELEVFQLLLGVSGIGPKIALMTLSFLSPERLRVAIVKEQVDVLAQVPGVGPKTARRVIFQLKDKLALGPLEAAPPLTDQDAEVIAALTALGYSVVEAQTALQSLPRDSELSIEERLRLALAYFG